VADLIALDEHRDGDDRRSVKLRRLAAEFRAEADRIRRDVHSCWETHGRGPLSEASLCELNVANELCRGEMYVVANGDVVLKDYAEVE